MPLSYLLSKYNTEWGSNHNPKFGEPFRVHEMYFADFFDWKDVTTQMVVNLNFNMDKEAVKLTDINM